MLAEVFLCDKLKMITFGLVLVFLLVVATKKADHLASVIVTLL